MGFIRCFFCKILLKEGGFPLLTYSLDMEPKSRWLRTTPTATALAQPYYCTEAGIFYANKGFATARSHKESYILFYSLEGKGLVEQGDKQIILEEGQGLLLNCRTPQSYCTAPSCSHWYHYWAHIDGMGVAAAAELLIPQGIVPVSLPALTAGECFEMLLQRVEDGSTLSVLQQSMVIHSILTEMSAQTLQNSNTASNRALVQQAADYIKANHAANLSLDKLVEAAHISKSYFLRLFRRYMGTTPYHYLLCCRITHAKELLVSTDLPIGMIGRQVGFPDEANFSTRFLRMAGQSPLQYRNVARQGSKEDF